MEFSRIPNRLKSFRRRKGLSRKKVSKALGYADTSPLYRWENGYYLPNTFQLFQLAAIYQVLPHDLFEDLWIELHKDENLLLSEESITSNELSSM